MPGGSWFKKLLGRDPSEGAGDDAETVPCSEVREHGSDWVDGECEEPLGTRIRMHLGLCVECDSWVRSLAATVGLVRDLPMQEAPESTREKVRQLMRQESGRE